MRMRVALPNPLLRLAAGLALLGIVGVSAILLRSEPSLSGPASGRDAGLNPPGCPPGMQDEPTATPISLAPEIADRRAALAAIERAYPPALKEAGIGGGVQVWMLITNRGNVARALIARSSGNAALDSAAVMAARTFQFRPAEYNGEKVCAWFRFPILFDRRW